MTPPTKVDISALKFIQLGNLDGLSPDDKAQLFKGTGLSYDPKTDNVDSEKHPGETNIDVEREYIRTIREANTSGTDQDGKEYLDLDEVKKLIQDSLPPEVAANTGPSAFLKNVQALMDGRYNQLGKNFQSFKGQMAFGATLDALNYYNYGLKSEAYRHANAVLPFNGLLTKSVTNIALGWNLGLWNQVTHKDTEDPHDPKNQALPADRWAMETADKNFEKRAAAINKLKEEIKKGVAANEKWALEADLDEGLKKLDAESQKLLVDQLAAKSLHKIMTTADPKARYDEMKKFADKERPGFGGFGSGNTTAGWVNTDDLWNISGHRHNTVFARTIYQFLATKAKTSDAEYNSVLRNENKSALADSQGDLGGFTNLVSIGGTAVLCSLGKAVTLGQKVDMSTCITDYRDWSDEEMIDMPGRSADGLIMILGANGVWNRGGQFRKLWSLNSENHLRTLAEAKAGEESLTFLDSTRAFGRGWVNTLPTWWQGARTWRPLTKAWNPFGKALNFAGNEEKYAEAIKSAELLAEGKPITGWWGRKFEAVLKLGNKLSPEQKALLAKGAPVGKKGWDLTKALIVVGIAGAADGHLNPAYNAFPIDRESDFERYPDPTRPPIVGGKK
ncbi:MAG TPA: hypothetical protein VJR29_01395 [bacterium]|nr:hypothetical protein [bacterium]